MDYYSKEKINKLVEFKDDTINACVLAKKDDNAALLFALKKNQKMPEHTSPLDAFLYVVEGEVDFISDECREEEFSIDKGEIFFFKAHEKHSVLAKKDSKILVVRI